MNSSLMKVGYLLKTFLLIKRTLLEECKTILFTWSTYVLPVKINSRNLYSMKGNITEKCSIHERCTLHVFSSFSLLYTDIGDWNIRKLNETTSLYLELQKKGLTIKLRTLKLVFLFLKIATIFQLLDFLWNLNLQISLRNERSARLGELFNI